MISLGILSNYKYTAGPASKQNYIIYKRMPVVHRVLEYVHVFLCQVCPKFLSYLLHILKLILLCLNHMY